MRSKRWHCLKSDSINNYVGIKKGVDFRVIYHFLLFSDYFLNPPPQSPYIIIYNHDGRTTNWLVQVLLHLGRTRTLMDKTNH